MSEKVSAFWSVQAANFEYLFFVVNWNDFSNSITESLEKNLDVLGQEIGLAGKVVQAYKQARHETFEEVVAKNGWSAEMLRRFDDEQYPFLLVINTSFEAFSPEKDLWSVVWFSDFRDNPDTIPEIFGKLVKKVRRGENLFDYFKSLAMKQTTKEWADYFEIKPSIFGVALDVKAMLEDVGDAAKRHFGRDA